MDITQKEWHALDTIEARWQVLATQGAFMGMDEFDIASHRNTFFTASATALDLAAKRLARRTNLPEEAIADVLSDLLDEISKFLLEQAALAASDKNPH